jgi:hypothetical protein
MIVQLSPEQQSIIDMLNKDNMLPIPNDTGKTPPDLPYMVIKDGDDVDEYMKKFSTKTGRFKGNVDEIKDSFGDDKHLIDYKTAKNGSFAKMYGYQKPKHTHDSLLKSLTKKLFMKGVYYALHLKPHYEAQVRKQYTYRMLLEKHPTATRQNYDQLMKDVAFKKFLEEN